MLLLLWYPSYLFYSDATAHLILGLYFQQIIVFFNITFMLKSSLFHTILCKPLILPLLLH